MGSINRDLTQKGQEGVCQHDILRCSGMNLSFADSRTSVKKVFVLLQDMCREHHLPTCLESYIYK